MTLMSGGQLWRRIATWWQSLYVVRAHRRACAPRHARVPGGWSPALTINKLCLSLRSMLASNTDKRRPHGDAEYCQRVGNRSPKLTRWNFDDDKV